MDQLDTQIKKTLTVAEFSAMYGVPVSTCRHWIQVGQGPKSSRVGRQRLYLKSDVAAWESEAFGAAA
jgi:DNA-binding transcriptional MerR regulator